MVAYGVFEPGKSAVMHKRVLKRDIAYWRCTKLITIGRIAGDRFEAEVYRSPAIHFRERLAEKLSIRINFIEPSQHLIANSEVVSGKDKSGHLDAFRRWNERLSH